VAEENTGHHVEGQDHERRSAAENRNGEDRNCPEADAISMAGSSASYGSHHRNRIPKQSIQCTPTDGHRKRGGPRKNWMSTVTVDL